MSFCVLPHELANPTGSLDADATFTQLLRNSHLLAAPANKFYDWSEESDFQVLVLETRRPSKVVVPELQLAVSEGDETTWVNRIIKYGDPSAAAIEIYVPSSVAIWNAHLTSVTNLKKMKTADNTGNAMVDQSVPREMIFER
jgi:hypothetical protein